MTWTPSRVTPAAYPTVALGTTSLYVDGTGGSDALGTGASAAPYATLRKAMLAILGVRARGGIQVISTYVKTSGSYVVPPEWQALENAPITTAGFESATRTVVSTHTIVAVSAGTGAAQGVEVQVDGSPGWTAGTSLRKHFIQRRSGSTYLGSPRPIEAATAADKMRVGGVQKWGTVQPTVPTDSGVAWAPGETVDVYTYGVLLNFTGYTPTSIGRFGASITGCQVGTATNQTIGFQSATLTLTNCVVLASMAPRSMAEARFVGCCLADAGIAVRNTSGITLHGCVLDGINGGNVLLENGSWLNLGHNIVVSNSYKIQRAPAARIFNYLGSTADRVYLMFSGAPGILLWGQTDGDTVAAGSAGPLDAEGQYGPGILAGGTLKAGEARWLVMHGGRAYLGGSDAVYQSDGTTPAKTSADGGSTDGTVDLASGTHLYGAPTYAADLATALIANLGATATPTASKIPIADAAGKLNGWVTSAFPVRAEFVQYPNNPLTSRFWVPANFVVTGITVYMKNTPTTAGTYTLKAEKLPGGSGGTPVTLLNAASYNLLSISPATDTPMTLTGTAADLLFAEGDLLRLTVTSDNADLAGVEDFVVQATLKPKP